jgi:hypothetical protein
MKVKELKEHLSGLEDKVEIKLYLNRSSLAIPFSDVFFSVYKENIEVYIEIDEFQVKSLKGIEKELKLPAAIKKNLEDVNETFLYGSPILNFTKRQIEEMVISFSKRREEDTEEKFRQIQILRRKS